MEGRSTGKLPVSERPTAQGVPQIENTRTRPTHRLLKDEAQGGQVSGTEVLGVTIRHQSNWDLQRHLGGVWRTMNLKKTTLANSWSFCSRDTFEPVKDKWWQLLRLNPGWTRGDISGIAQGRFLQPGQCGDRQLCHAVQRELGALDLSGCDTRRDEVCLSPKSGRIVSHPLLESNSCHPSKGGSNTELWVM